MGTGFRRGIAVVAGLLLAGGLFAGQSGVQNVATAGLLSSPGPGSPPSPCGSGTNNLHDDDVGVAVIISPNDTFLPFGDRAFPRGRVQNLGSQTQTNIPVICVIYDSAAGARVYGPDTVYVASLDSGGVCTVTFPYWAPAPEENVYFDTMTTALRDDQDTSNDWRAGRFSVSDWGEGHLSYNDGTFENAVTWIFAGSQLTERFAAPERPLTVSKAVLWLTSMTGDDYDAEVMVYGNDGSPHGNPGTQLGAWVGKLHTDTFMQFYKNEIPFDPPIKVNYDAFFVSYYETSLTPSYPYLALDTADVPIHIGNDWGWCNKDSFRTWGPFSFDSIYDFGIDAYYEALLLDGTSAGIAVPPGQIDSNTTFTPQVVVKNAGLVDRDNIPVKFSIARNSAFGDVVYSDSANTGPIAAGQEVTVTFSGSVKPQPGSYIMTSITLLSYDGRTANDTLVRPLIVGVPGIAGENAAAGRPSVSIAPNPIGRSATARYSLPKAGLVTFDLYDVTGRKVLTQTITAGPPGSAKLDLRKLKAGVYTVKVKANGYSTTQKLVVER